MKRERKSILVLLASVYLLSVLAFVPAYSINILGVDAALMISDQISVTPVAGAPAGEMFRWNWKPAPAVVTIYYRIDPAYNAAEVAAIERAFATWNATVAVQPNIQGTLAVGVDLESVILHEIGHAIGLGHPDRGTVPPTPQHWDTDLPPAGPLVPNPWDLFAPGADITNQTLYVNRCAERGVYGPPFIPFPVGVSGAIMSYTANLGGFPNEVHRQLEFDDVNGFSLTERGADGILGGGDDIIYFFARDGVNWRAPVVDLPGGDGLVATFDDWDATTFGGNQRNGGDVDIFKGVPAQFPPAVLGITDVHFDRLNALLGGTFNIYNADIYLDSTMVIIPDSDVPTLGQWGLIILLVLLLVTASIFIVRRQRAAVG